MKTNIIRSIWALCALFALSACSQQEVTESSIQVATQEFSNLSQTQAVGMGYILENQQSVAVEEVGLCYATTILPSITDLCVVSAEAVSLGSFTASLTGLQPATQYYGRAYVRANGRVHYGNQIQFTTRAIPTQGWCVIDGVSGITPTSAMVQMLVADDGGNDILEYGITYNRTGAPEVGDSEVVSPVGGARFDAKLTSLAQATKYFVTPYFKTATSTVTGETKEFSTLNFIRTDWVSSGFRTAYVTGQVVMDAGVPTTERGFCWGDNENIDVDNADSKATGKGVGKFYALVSGLTKGSEYYVRAYARNDDGIFYGEPVKFTTRTGDVLPNFDLSQMVKVEKGTFDMGEPNTSTISSAITAGIFDKEPVHTVQLTKDYYMCKFEVTNEQICQFFNIYQSTTNRATAGALYNSSGRTWAFNMSGSAPNIVYTPVTNAAKKPTANITWGAAQQFLEWLSAELGVECRMPTEAEWEYASRGGKESKGYIYSGSNVRSEVGVFQSSAGPKVVGSLAANELGLYDMSGNIFEYCSDFWTMDDYLSRVGKTTVDPFAKGPVNGAKNIRGGSFRHDLYQRNSGRGMCKNEADCGTHSGMRIVMSRLPVTL